MAPFLMWYTNEVLVWWHKKREVNMKDAVRQFREHLENAYSIIDCMDGLELTLMDLVSKTEDAQMTSGSDGYTEVLKLIETPNEAVDALKDQLMNWIYATDIHGGVKGEDEEGYLRNLEEAMERLEDDNIVNEFGIIN